MTRYPHFMINEIYEQPKCIAATLKKHVHWSLDATSFKTISHIVIVGCGSAYYAGLTAKSPLENQLKIPVDVVIASEFTHSSIINRHTLVIAISQSGETGDTHDAIRYAKKNGARTMAILNVKNSTIAKYADTVLYTEAGNEKSIAATKSFTTQLLVLYLLGNQVGLTKLPALMKATLSCNALVASIAKKYHNARNVILLGRGNHYPIAHEAALKLKETSYIPSEGFPTREFKHGPMALVDSHSLVIAIAPKDNFYSDSMRIIKTIKSYGAPIIGITTKGNLDLKRHTSDVIYIPKCSNSLAPFLTIIPLQLFAYHMAVLNGLDVDHPRHLTKAII